jgi:hypothetical protein
MAMTGFLDDYPFLRNVSSPLSPKMLSPLDSRCRVVQFSEPLAESDYLKLSAFLSDYPSVSLRVYGGINPMEDLEFLRFFPAVTKFQADLWRLGSLSGLRHLSPELTFLGLGAAKAKSLSLGILARFENLEELFIEGLTKDMAAVGNLRNLQRLTLRSITLPDLSLMKPLKKLISLDLKLGGTRNLALLPEIGTLKYLELWMIKGFSDLSSVSSMPHLQFLFLQALRNVMELPDMKNLARLRRIHLETMKGVTSLDSLASAPALEELLVLDCSHLNVEDFTCLKGHPSLKRVSVGLGSIRKNEGVKELLGLPETSPRTEFRFS